MDIKKIPTKQQHLYDLFSQVMNSHYKEENEQLKTKIKVYKKNRISNICMMTGFIGVAFYMGYIADTQQAQIQHLMNQLQDPASTEATIVNYTLPEEISTKDLIWHKNTKDTHPTDNIRA